MREMPGAVRCVGSAVASGADHDAPFGRAVGARAAVDHLELAGAVRPDQRGLAPADVEAHVVDRPHAANKSETCSTASRMSSVAAFTLRWPFWPADGAFAGG